jgi:protein TonB
MPQFPGGEEALFKFIALNLKYPIIDGDGMQGKVICRFIINKDGSVSDIKVIRSLDTSCDAEAIKVLKLLPKFIPGKQNGKNVRVWYTIPIAFKLE